MLLDNQAVQALQAPRHRKHRRALALIEAQAHRSATRAGDVRLMVPTTVRVEDAELDGTSADLAAGVRRALHLSVADAHLAAVLASTPPPHAVLTSDVDDVQRIASHLTLDVRVIRI